MTSRSSLSSSSSSSSSSSAASASLLGYDDWSKRREEEKNRMSAQTEEWIEQSNDAQLVSIGSKISTVKELTLGIRKEVQRSTDELDRLESGLSLSGGLLKGSMNRLANVTQSATKKHMIYLVGFVVAVFLTAYYGLSFF